jgi:hypothetical protein
VQNSGERVILNNENHESNFIRINKFEKIYESNHQMLIYIHYMTRTFNMSIVVLLLVLFVCVELGCIN